MINPTCFHILPSDFHAISDRWNTVCLKLTGFVFSAATLTQVDAICEIPVRDFEITKLVG
jgi:hypothetical protein